MNRTISRAGTLIAAICFLGFSVSCDDDEPPLPDNALTFSASSAGLGDDDNEAEITLNASRPVASPVAVTLSLTTEGVAYGEHFTTVPAAQGSTLVVTIPANASSVSFKVVREADVFLEGDESITFVIVDADDPVVIGGTAQVVLSFSSIVSEGAELTLNGILGAESGASAGNSVFVDLSENVQVPVARTSWDLGFYNGDDFRVIINYASGATAVMVDKTDLSQVTAADIDPDVLVAGLGQGTLDIIDDPHGDLDNTVIPAVSETDSENKVYVINRVGGHGGIGPVEDLVKVRILRNDDGYTVQYAAINESEFATADISKGDTHNFEFFSFEEGKVSVEPAHDKWDFVWTWSMYFTGAPGNYIPYGFSDLVFVNHHGGTQAAEVMATGGVTYDGFGEDNLAGVTFEEGRSTIGSGWRVTSPADQAGVKTDRFYLIKDAAGNVYKLRFVSFHPGDGGTRGKPVIEYALVKKG